MGDFERRGRVPVGRAVRALAACAMLSCSVSAAMAQADWRTEVGKLRIGMVARPGAGATLAGVASIEKAYARALGIPVVVFVARDFPALIDAQASARVDYAIYSAAAYATADRLCGCVEALAAPVSADGSIGTRSLLVARAGSLARADAFRLGVVADETIARADYRARSDGVAIGDVGKFVDVPAESDEHAERLFADGAVDGFFGWEPIAAEDGKAPEKGSLARLARLGVDASDIEIVWESQPLRFGPHAVRKALPAPLKLALRRFLIALRDADPDVYDLLEEERQGGFVGVGGEDYAALADMVARIATAAPAEE